MGVTLTALSSAMKVTAKEYIRLKEMATKYLESEEGKEEDPNLEPNEWIMGVLLAEKLYADGQISLEVLQSIPGYDR